MLYYNRINIGKGNDLTESSNSKECRICHYWFFNHGFKFQWFICNGCPNFIMCHNISDITIITVKNVDHCYIIYSISKSGAIDLLKSFVLENRGYIYKNNVFHFSLLKAVFFALLYIK